MTKDFVDITKTKYFVPFVQLLGNNAGKHKDISKNLGSYNFGGTYLEGSVGIVVRRYE